MGLILRSPLVLFHGTTPNVTQLDPSATSDGLVHFGTFEQAMARQRGRIIAAGLLISINRLLRVRDADTTEQWKKRAKRALDSGYDGLVYLNRHEGVPMEVIDAAQQRGLKLSGLGDAQFRMLHPNAADSVAVIDRASIQVLCIDAHRWDPLRLQRHIDHAVRQQREGAVREAQLDHA